MPVDWWTRWNWDPWLLAALAAGAAAGAWLAYARRPPRRAIASAAAAWLLLVLLFVSPLCALTTALFAARVVHHVLLFAVAAPLLAVAGAALLPGPGGRRLLLAAFLVHLAAVWVWHAPAPYAAALASDGIYWLMQLTLLGSGLLFWQVALSPRTDRLAALLLLLGTMAHMGLLGALITFAPQALYAPHALTTMPWGLTQLADQQLGGLVMWVPAALPYLAAAVAVALPLLRPLAAGRS